MSRLSKMLADHVAVFHRADFSLADMTPPDYEIYDQLSLIYQKRMLITLQLLINDPRLLFRQIRHS